MAIVSKPYLYNKQNNMKPFTLITDNKDIKDVELRPKKFGTVTVYSIRIIENILICVSIRDSKSPILGREQLQYTKITKPMLNYFNKQLTLNKI